jgi:hypothetical protein
MIITYQVYDCGSSSKNFLSGHDQVGMSSACYERTFATKAARSTGFAGAAMFASEAQQHPMVAPGLGYYLLPRAGSSCPSASSRLPSAACPHHQTRGREKRVNQGRRVGNGLSRANGHPPLSNGDEARGAGIRSGKSKSIIPNEGLLRARPSPPPDCWAGPALCLSHGACLTVPVPQGSGGWLPAVVDRPALSPWPGPPFPHVRGTPA